MLSHFLPRPRWIALLVGLVLLSHGSTAFALGKLGLTVRAITYPRKEPAGKKPPKVKKDYDDRKLEATLKNSSSEAMPGLVIKYFFLGKKDAAPEITVMEADEITKDLAPGALLAVSSKTASAVYTPAYTTRPAKNSKERAEHVKASGDRFTGWGVQVFSGTEMVAEAYSSPVLKAVINPPDATPKS